MKRALYQEYEQIKARYESIQEAFTALLLERERLFTKMLPNAITYDKDHVLSSVGSNPLEEYAISLDVKGIGEKLARYRQALHDWRDILETKERELRKSQNIIDKIYVLRIIERRGINNISRILHYSSSQVSRIVAELEEKGIS